eukprot:gene9232-19147_t
MPCLDRSIIMDRTTENFDPYDPEYKPWRVPVISYKLKPIIPISKKSKEQWLPVMKKSTKSKINKNKIKVIIKNDIQIESSVESDSEMQSLHQDNPVDLLLNDIPQIIEPKAKPNEAVAADSASSILLPIPSKRNRIYNIKKPIAFHPINWFPVLHPIAIYITLHDNGIITPNNFKIGRRFLVFELVHLEYPLKEEDKNKEDSSEAIPQIQSDSILLID